MRKVPSNPRPIIFAIIIATSQVTFNNSAKPARTHRAGGSSPSSGTEPDNHTIADLFSSNLPPTTSPLVVEIFG